VDEPPTYSSFPLSDHTARPSHFSPFRSTPTSSLRPRNSSHPPPLQATRAHQQLHQEPSNHLRPLAQALVSCSTNSSRPPPTLANFRRKPPSSWPSRSARYQAKVRSVRASPCCPVAHALASWSYARAGPPERRRQTGALAQRSRHRRQQPRLPPRAPQREHHTPYPPWKLSSILDYALPSPSGRSTGDCHGCPPYV